MEGTIEKEVLGHLGGSGVERLPSVQGVTPGSWDRVPPQGACVSLCLYVCLSLCLSYKLINKNLKK